MPALRCGWAGAAAPRFVNSNDEPAGAQLTAGTCIPRIGGISWPAAEYRNGSEAELGYLSNRAGPARPPLRRNALHTQARHPERRRCADAGSSQKHCWTRPRGTPGDRPSDVAHARSTDGLTCPTLHGCSRARSTSPARGDSPGPASVEHPLEDGVERPVPQPADEVRQLVNPSAQRGCPRHERRERNAQPRPGRRRDGG